MGLCSRPPTFFCRCWTHQNDFGSMVGITALRNLAGHVVLHLVKQECHRYSLGNRHIDLHANSQVAEHMTSPDEPPLHDHLHTHP